MDRLLGIGLVLSAFALAVGGALADVSDPNDDFELRLLTDAATRPSLLQSGRAPDPGFDIGGTIQVRYNANFRQQDAAGTVDDFESGFLIRRARIKLSGELDLNDADGTLPWVLQTDTSRSTGNVFLLDAWSGYETGNWRFRGGQFIPPLTREALVSNSRRMAVEVSPVTGAFSTSGAGGRTQGVEARYRNDRWSTSVMVGDGDRGGNRSFEADEGDIGLYVRVERKIGEDGWSRFRDFTSKRGSDNAVLLGAAGLVTVGETDADGDGLQAESFYEFIGSADMSYEGDGWNAFVASHFRYRSAQAVDNSTMFGVSGHVARYVRDDLELFTQYSWMVGPDSDGELSVLVAGFNKFIVGHTVKLTADALYSFNEITDAYASSSRALLQDAPGERGQVALRAQLQLLF
ncbi:MAG: porin [Planctomycetota bacterium]